MCVFVWKTDERTEEEETNSGNEESLRNNSLNRFGDNKSNLSTLQRPGTRGDRSFNRLLHDTRECSTLDHGNRFSCNHSGRRFDGKLNKSNLSSMQRPDTRRNRQFNPLLGDSPECSTLDHGNGFLCNHFKRRCHVKFECCDKFWPCHRCHNDQSTCGRKNLKGRHTKMLKCANCGKIQEVTKTFRHRKKISIVKLHFLIKVF